MLEAGKRGSPGRAVQAGIRGKRLKKTMPHDSVFPQRYRRRWNSTIVTISSKLDMLILDDIVTIVEFHRQRYRCVNRCRAA